MLDIKRIRKDLMVIAEGLAKREFKFDTELNSEERYSPDIVESLEI